MPLLFFCSYYVDHSSLSLFQTIQVSFFGTWMFQIGVLIEDKDFVDSSMGGKPWKAGKFAFSLRLSLWSEHLGLHAGEVSKY